MNNLYWKNIRYLMILSGFLLCGSAFSQQKVKTDTIKSKITNKDHKDDRNVMLNAAKSNQPREVNIGLPASVGGTTVLENGLPVVYYFWPELSPKTWRQDVMINKSKLHDLGQTVIQIGDVGFSVSTFDNLGTDKFQGTGILNSNHFGLLRGDLNLSGALNQKGTKFSVGAYLNFDPGTFKAKGLPKYYSDKTQMYKGALTQDYSFNGGTGTVSVMYKYINTQGVSGYLYAPFLYKKGGKTEELAEFKMGGDSYFETSGRIMLKDAYTGEYVNRNVVKDCGAASHTFDLIWKNTLNNGLHINLASRYHASKVGFYLPSMTGVASVGSTQYTYADTGEKYTGSNVQAVLAIASKKRPIDTFMATLEIGKKSGSHDWNIGLNQWNYSVDRYTAEGVIYYQEVAANPRKLIKAGSGVDQYGNMFGGLDYHNGSENKTALFITDKWDISDIFTLNLGVRMEYLNLRGDYQDRKWTSQNENLNGTKTKIKKDWLNKSFMLSGIYKMTGSFGLLGDITYNEQAGCLDKYTVGEDPNIKQSRIPEAGLGVYFNHPMISLVSKATFIQRDQYRQLLTFTNPNNISDIKRTMPSYKIQTLGWTTDILTSPFKGFELHLLVTIQAPKYLDFADKVAFSDGSVVEYNFNDKTVTGISKVLLEIDPSYTWRDLRIWASARYFSKQYLNKPNTLPLESHWETFAGASYKLNKYLNFNITAVNLLNQRGASGAIPGGDLITTDKAAESKYNTIMTGKYIRPFTLEFGVKYRF